MVAEGLVLVALFHIGFLGGLLFQRLRLGLRLSVPVLEPRGQVQGLGGSEDGLTAIEYGQGEGAVRLLSTLGLHKVDGGIAHKVGYKQVVGLVIDGQGGVVLLEDAVVDQADLGGQGHGLHLVVGDVDKGGACLHMEALELIAHFQAQLGVQVGQRFIHEQHRGLGGQRAGDGYALLLTAGQLGGVAVHEHADLDDAGDPPHGQVDLLLRQLAQLGDHPAALELLKVLIQSPGLSRGLRLGAETGDLAGEVLPLLHVIAKELFGRVEGDSKGVDQLDIGLLLVQSALLVPALFQHPDHLVGAGQDLRQPGGVFGLRVHLGQLLPDVGQAERNVLVDGHVGPQGIILKQEAHLPLVGRDVDTKGAVKHHLIADGNTAAGGGLQAGDHAQDGGLSAAGGAKQGDEGVVFYDQVQIVHPVELAPALRHMF